MIEELGASDEREGADGKENYRAGDLGRGSEPLKYCFTRADGRNSTLHWGYREGSVKARSAGSQYNEGLVLLSFLDIALNRLSNKGTSDADVRSHLSGFSAIQPLPAREEIGSLIVRRIRALIWIMRHINTTSFTHSFIHSFRYYIATQRNQC